MDIPSVRIFLFPFLKDIHNISLMLSIQAESLCFCISLGLYKEQQRHLHVLQRQGDRKNTDQKQTVLAWRLFGSLSRQQPLPPPWIGVIVQCNHIMPHLNIHSRDKALEDKGDHLNIKQHTHSQIKLCPLDCAPGSNIKNQHCFTVWNGGVKKMMEERRDSNERVTLYSLS